jgi:hypothetical protein
MTTAFLIILLALGLIMPLFWIIGTMTSIGYVCISRSMEIVAKHREANSKAHKISKANAAAFNGQLGVTMADGGDSVDKEKK